MSGHSAFDEENDRCFVTDALHIDRKLQRSKPQQEDFAKSSSKFRVSYKRSDIIVGAKTRRVLFPLQPPV